MSWLNFHLLSSLFLHLLHYPRYLSKVFAGACSVKLRLMPITSAICSRNQAAGDWVHLINVRPIMNLRPIHIAVRERNVRATLMNKRLIKPDERKVEKTNPVHAMGAVA